MSFNNPSNLENLWKNIELPKPKPCKPNGTVHEAIGTIHDPNGPISNPLYGIPQVTNVLGKDSNGNSTTMTIQPKVGIGKDYKTSSMQPKVGIVKDDRTSRMESKGDAMKDYGMSSLQPKGGTVKDYRTSSMESFGDPIDCDLDLEDLEDDAEVEIININNRVSREFSLSRYDIAVHQFRRQSSNNHQSYSDSNSRSPEDHLDDEADYENVFDSRRAHSDGFGEGREVISNQIAGSGHVTCDCENCTNQREGADCDCENCLSARGVTHTEHTPSEREVICNCEDCANNSRDSYTCECENCLRLDKDDDKPINNNIPGDTCKCENCLGHGKHTTEVCNCEKCCEEIRVADSSTPDLAGRSNGNVERSSPHDYVNFDLPSISEHEDSLDCEHCSHLHNSKSDNSHLFHENGSNSSHVASDVGYDIQYESESENDEVLDISNLCEHCDDGHSLDEGCAINILNDNENRCRLGHKNVTADGCMCDTSAQKLPRRHHYVQSPVNVNINRLLEDQLQKSEVDLKKKDGDHNKQVAELRKECDKQQKLITQNKRRRSKANLSLTPEAKLEATMQHEIGRLTSENLDLRETIDIQADQIRKLKKMLKVYAKRLKEGDAAEIQAELEREETKSVENVAHVKHRDRNYMGMLEYKKDDENTVIKTLILELRPRVAAGQIPGLPAYIMFMCVRHTDYINDDEKVRSLLTNTINGIKKCVKKHHDDLDRVTMWLANTCRFLHTLKQYSGEKAFQNENSARQNEHCLRNFDLAEYRQVFSDLAVWIYQTLIKLMEATIQPSIVPAVLEHEAIAGLTGSKPSGLRGRSSSVTADTVEYSLDTMMKSLNQFVRVLNQHAVDPELTKQIFRQLYYFLGASALNNLLLRKDMCNWSKGMQIRYNLSHCEQWLRDNKLQESGAGSTLEPIVQASQLLQARKTEADVESVCDMCSKLSVPQIVKILNLYTPVDEFEERVPIAFIRKIQQRLKSRDNPDNSLLMNLRFSYSVTFPFNPSNIALESIEVPSQLHLSCLTRH